MHRNDLLLVTSEHNYQSKYNPYVVITCYLREILPVPQLRSSTTTKIKINKMRPSNIDLIFSSITQEENIIYQAKIFTLF